jgi:hypothetical protein
MDTRGELKVTLFSSLVNEAILLSYMSRFKWFASGTSVKEEDELLQANSKRNPCFAERLYRGPSLLRISLFPTIEALNWKNEIYGVHPQRKMAIYGRKVGEIILILLLKDAVCVQPLLQPK